MKHIAILHSCPTLPVITDHGEHSTQDVELTVCTLDESGTQPRNASWKWDGPKFQPGGMRLRIYSSCYGAPILISGRAISHCGDAREYLTAGRALETLSKRTEAMVSTRGTAADPAEDVSRFLEACGVTEVFYRPGFKSESWHSDGEWNRIPSGTAVEMIRKATEAAHSAYLARKAA